MIENEFNINSVPIYEYYTTLTPTPSATSTPTPTPTPTSSQPVFDCCKDYQLYGGESCRFTYFEITYCDNTKETIQVKRLQYLDVECVLSIKIINVGEGVSQGCGFFNSTSECKCCEGSTQYCTPTPTTTPTISIRPTSTPTNTPTPTTSEQPEPQPIIDPCNTDAPVSSIQNECNVITLYEMVIECQVNKHPSTKNSFDGSISINIEGGTPPYTIFWENGVIDSNYNFSTLNNLSAGTYGVTVTDSYGDFVKATTCLLEALEPTPSPTLTPTLTSIPYGDMCVIIYKQGNPQSYIYFLYDGMVDGKPKWKSTTVNFESDTTYTITYYEDNKWKLNGLGMGITAVSTSQPPLTNWNVFGSYEPTTLEVKSSAGQCGFFAELSVPNINSQGEPCATTVFFDPPSTSSQWNFEYSVNSGSGDYSIEFYNEETETWEKLYDFMGPSNGTNIPVQFILDVPYPEYPFEYKKQYNSRIHDNGLNLNSQPTPFYVCASAF